MHSINTSVTNTSLPSPPTSPEVSNSSQKRKREDDYLHTPRKRQQCTELNLQHLRAYLEAGGSPNVRDERHRIRLVEWTCRVHSLSALRLLLLHKVDPYSVLHLAVTVGFLDGVAEVCEQGININRINTLGRTALHIAAQHNRPKILQYLLCRGATPSLRDQHEHTPLQLAIFNHHVDCVEVLCNVTNEPDVVKDAVMIGYAPVLRLLLRKYPLDQHSHDVDWLQLAIHWNRLDCVSVLVEEEHTTITSDAIYTAVQQRKLDLVRMLCGGKGSPCVKGHNPSLVYAASHGFKEMLPLLLTQDTSKACLQQAWIMADASIRHYLIQLLNTHHQHTITPKTT
ncbi:ankyrin repeat-containing domain protein [Radiomyces spectabilis]|uniref:ankyrin repeat-containing domain protein n=1 Tax=Radiomyces spectabilis TaxID=64574 RepID=UPI00221EDF9A|nr:ankyrin repeat-containing domain protein [Radiomyces spectabilis]KAI8381073.1 ankyrin repeat-containing domain protein [Radiomyces spectabilis]